jgi:hypothetical protein
MFSKEVMSPIDFPPNGKQALFSFDNYVLSVVQHSGSYGNAQGLYEIGIFEGDNMVEMPGITEPGDTVKGFLSETEVNGIIKKMTSVTGVEPFLFKE